MLPSYNEGLPMSVLEGMASGKAIISTNVGAIPEVIQEDNGILIQPGDIHALADALMKCSSDINMLSHMSAANIKKLTDNSVCERCMKICKNCTAKFLRCHNENKCSVDLLSGLNAAC